MINPKSKINSIYVIIGLFWILLVLYARLIVTKPPYSLFDLKYNMTPLKLCFIISFIIIQKCIIIKVIHDASTKVNKKQGKLTRKFNRIINTIYWLPLEKLHDKIAPIIPYSGTTFYRFSAILCRFDLKYAHFFVIMFSIMPKFIAAITFFIEIMFFNQLKYFLLIMVILLLPLCWRVFVKLFISFAQRNIANLNDWLDITPIGQTLPNGLSSQYEFAMKNNYSDEHLKEYVMHWKNLMQIYGIGTAWFQDFYQKTNPYVMLICSALYLSSGIYRLIYILS